MKFAIRSRLGRAVLSVLGLLYLAASVAVLSYYVTTNWGANGLTDYAFQLALIATALGGVFLVLTGTDNFRAWRSGASSRPTTERHKAAAV